MISPEEEKKEKKGSTLKQPDRQQSQERFPREVIAEKVDENKVLPNGEKKY